MQNIFQLFTNRKTKITNQSLKKWNIILFGLYIIQGGAILLFSAAHYFQINSLFVTNDALQTKLTGETVTAPAVHQLFTINLVGPVAAFIFVAAIIHLLIATIFRPQYELWFKKNINPFRWLEYGLCGGIILVVIGLLAGIYDIASLFLLFTLAIIAALSGLIIEAQTTTIKQKLLPKWLGNCVTFVAVLVPWFVIGFYILATDIFGAGTPGYMYALYPLMLLLFVAIAINTYLVRTKKGDWSNYLYSEYWHMGLSFTVQSLLAWLIFIYVLHP